MFEKAKNNKIFLICLLSFIAACFLWWWMESYVSCDTQDEYSLRGACLAQVKNGAINGQVGAQWAYGDYLSNNGDKGEAARWYRTALQNSTKALDLMGRVGHCDKDPGLDHHALESKIQSISQRNPDAHLLLLELYLSHNCRSFNLEKASATIPRLTQCAYLALGEYIRLSERMHHPIKNTDISNIKDNLKLCHADLRKGQQDDSILREFIPLQKKSLDELERAVEKLNPE